MKSWNLAALLSGSIVALIIGTSVSVSAAEPEKAPRAARSVHLGYPAPEALLFYNEMVVEKSTGGSYFMVCGWSTGYFGIQELPDHRKVILFSVWDAAKGDDAQSVKGEDRVECLYQATDVKIRRFGGEGTGGQCMGDFGWALGETNRFVLKAEVESEKTSYSGYVWVRAKNLKTPREEPLAPTLSPSDGAREKSATNSAADPSREGWKRLATFRVRTGGAPLRGLYSFVEDFRRDTKSAAEVRRAQFGNGWVQSVNGDWVPLDEARFTASNSPFEAKETIDAGFDGAWFYLVTGGDTQMKAKLRDIIQGRDRKGMQHPQGLPLKR